MPNLNQQTQQEQEQQATFVRDGRDHGFSHGVMIVDGRAQRPVEVQHWLSSNELTTYTTVKWQDPVTGELRTSCNCAGWAIKKGSRRECCHTKDMEGITTCRRKKAGGAAVIHSAAEAAAEIPDIVDGKELRGITF